jgi:hypothetical protein
LTPGPPTVEGGAYNQTLFASTSGGDLLAFDALGQPRNVFVNGQSRVSTAYTFGLSLFTSVFNFQGLSFSPLDQNLWHVTPTRGGDAPADLGQHGVMSSFDNDFSRFSLDIPTGGRSFYFGMEDPRTISSADPQVAWYNYIARDETGDSEELSGNEALFGSYNLPGGAYGSLVSGTFSLEGYSTGDKPTLYFNYALDTQGANSKASGMRDSFRVFASSDGFNWLPLTTNNSVKSAVFTTDAELPTYISDSGGTYRGDKVNQRVQEAFDAPGLEGTPQGHIRNEFDEEFPTTAVGWRQARVDLGDFAGQSNIRLRFDFSTAGTMNQGLPGDQFGQFATPYQADLSTLPDGQQIFTLNIGTLAPRERGQNNAHQGVFIDDVIVGFAGRGEMGSPAISTPGWPSSAAAIRRRASTRLRRHRSTPISAIRSGCS